MNGALLINKHAGPSSFGIIEMLQHDWMDRFGCKKRDLPKLGHGGTLDPFASGLLVILVGRAVKLARYFLGSDKTYEGHLLFGETTLPGDPTEPVSEKSDLIPESISIIEQQAHQLTLQPYCQIPPMHSAKKKNGKPLYLLARAGIEIEREAKSCQLYEFKILDYQAPMAQFRVVCSSGTYIRTLAQDLGRLCGSVAHLKSLKRTSAGSFQIEKSWTLEQVLFACQSGQKWNELDCWIPFDQLLAGYHCAQATDQERIDLSQGKQDVLLTLLKNREIQTQNQLMSPDHSKADKNWIAIYCNRTLVATARNHQGNWELERVFP